MKLKSGDKVKVYTVYRPSYLPYRANTCIQPTPHELIGVVSTVDPVHGLVMVDREWFHPKQCKKVKK